MDTPTPKKILDLPLFDDNTLTIRDSLIELLAALWEQGSDFSSKRPFGNSDWQQHIYATLIHAGFVRGKPYDTATADLLIDAAIRHLT